MPILTSPSNSNEHLSLDLSGFQNDIHSTECNSSVTKIQNEVINASYKIVKCDSLKVTNDACSKVKKAYCLDSELSKDEKDIFLLPSVLIQSHMEFENKAVTNFDELTKSSIKINSDGDNTLNQNSKCMDFFETNCTDTIDELKMLLIQKECEIISLKSELEISKQQASKQAAMGCLPIESFPEKKCHINYSNPIDNEDNIIIRKLIEKIKAVESSTTLYSNSEVQCEEVLKIPYHTTSLEENQESISINENVAKYETNVHIGVFDLARLIMVLKDPTNKVQTQSFEYEKMELEREKTLILQKNLHIQQERLALEDYRIKLYQEKQELEKTKMKIEIELRKLLDDDEQDNVKDEEKNDKYDQVVFDENGETDAHNSLKQNSNSLPNTAKEKQMTYEKITKKESESNEEYNELLELKPHLQDSTSGSLDEEDDEAIIMVEADTEEIVDECENKLNHLYNFMTAWKIDAMAQAHEAKVMRDKGSICSKTFCQNHSNHGTHQIPVKALKKEWQKIEAANKKIEKCKESLICKEYELKARVQELEEKERLVNEDKIEMQKEKKIFEEKLARLNLDADQIEMNKGLLERETKILDELRKTVEKEKLELSKMKTKYDEDMQLAEEIHNQVDESRTQEILQQQKCLEEKWGIINNEKEELSKAWRRYDEQQTILEFDKSSFLREQEGIIVEKKSLAGEKLALEKYKITMEESRVLLEKEWEELKSKRCLLDQESNCVEEKKKIFAEEWDMINSEKLRINELKQSLLRRENEIKEEKVHLEENRREMSERVEKLEQLKREAEAERETLEKEKKECSKMKYEYKIKKIELKKILKLKKFEHTRKIRKKVLSFTENVCSMEVETASCKTMQMAVEEKNNLHPQFGKDNKKSKDFSISHEYFYQKHLQQRIHSLLDTVNSMEKDAWKIRVKIDEKVWLQKKMKNQMYYMQDQRNAMQKNITETNAVYKHEFCLTPRFKDAGDNRFTKRLEEEYYIIDLTAPNRSTLVTDKSKQLGSNRRNMYALQDKKHCSRFFKEVSMLENHSYEPNNERLNIDDWEKGVHLHIGGNAPVKMQNCEEMLPILKGKTYRPDNILNKQVQSSHRVANP